MPLTYKGYHKTKEKLQLPLSKWPMTTSYFLCKESFLNWPVGLSSKKSHDLVVCKWCNLLSKTETTDSSSATLKQNKQTKKLIQLFILEFGLEVHFDYLFYIIEFSSYSLWLPNKIKTIITCNSISLFWRKNSWKSSETSVVMMDNSFFCCFMWAWKK